MPDLPETVVIVTEALAGRPIERWAALIDEAVALHPRVVVLDLRSCPQLDAAAIAELLRVHRTLMHAGGRLTLRGPGGRVRRTLRLAGLDRVFDVEAPVPA